MQTSAYDFIVVGGGIVGLATAHELSQRFRGQKVAVVEKEDCLAAHQTGRNSGVIHSGIYYKPGSLKARTCVEGAALLKQFCQQQHVAMQVTGKVIIATCEQELAKLEEIYQRGVANGVPGVQKIDAGRLREIEPHARGISAIWVPSTGIVDYFGVCQKFAQIIRERGGSVLLREQVIAIRVQQDVIQVQTLRGVYTCRYLINCAGLHSDRVAAMSGIKPSVRIIPFRGEYYRLRPQQNDLVRGLIYPVPDPAFPFLGVHFTRMVDGKVEVGPNAVLSLQREGYSKFAFDLRDSFATLAYGGFWKMSARYWQRGVEEMLRSFVKRLFVQSAQKLVPAVRACDLVPEKSGVRAQALDRAGNLVDDFCIEASHRMIHVLNAPSPAATACLTIARAIVDMAKQKWSV